MSYRFNSVIYIYIWLSLPEHKTPMEYIFHDQYRPRTIYIITYFQRPYVVHHTAQHYAINFAGYWTAHLLQVDSSRYVEVHILIRQHKRLVIILSRICLYFLEIEAGFWWASSFVIDNYISFLGHSTQSRGNTRPHDHQSLAPYHDVSVHMTTNPWQLITMCPSTWPPIHGSLSQRVRPHDLQSMAAYHNVSVHMTSNPWQLITTCPSTWPPIHGSLSQCVRPSFGQ